jgi:pimeloyl-ACP methyl ester carboxylesterase
MPERIVQANGIEIWTEALGNPADPPILLIMGSGGQGIHWEDGFCRLLVDGGRYVIRYDQRDTGQSAFFDFDKSPYTVSDLAADAIGLMDAYGFESSHVVGQSLGGMVAQAIAIEHPGRMRTLTSIMSTPGVPKRPATSHEERASEAAPGPPPTREEWIERRVEVTGRMSGSLVPYDEARRRALAVREAERVRNFDSNNNHGRAMAISPDRLVALGEVRVPTLVIHGTGDPAIPHSEGVATANAIPGAKLLTIEKLGHELPKAVWPEITEAILRHTG